jgi:outer membrane cobalamin receptor
VKAIVYAAMAFSAAATFENAAQAQADASLDEVVVTAKSLEDELPQQLSHYGTRVDVISAAEIVCPHELRNRVQIAHRRGTLCE